MIWLIVVSLLCFETLESCKSRYERFEIDVNVNRRRRPGGRWWPGGRWPHPNPNGGSEKNMFDLNKSRPAVVSPTQLWWKRERQRIEHNENGNRILNPAGPGPPTTWPGPRPTRPTRWFTRPSRPTRWPTRHTRRTVGRPKGKSPDQSALGELLEEIGTEIDLITGQGQDTDQHGKGLIPKLIQWLEQIKLVIIAFGIF